MSSTYEEYYYNAMFYELTQAKEANNEKLYNELVNDLAAYETKYGGDFEELKEVINKDVIEMLED